MTRTLLIDNYDSFTYNLYDLLASVNGTPPTVIENDVTWSSVHSEDFDNIVISPGPGRPEVERDFGIGAEALAQRELPVLGVCLGHQGLCHLAGGRVALAPEPRHGRVSEILHDSSELFAGLPSPFQAVRYHSLIVDRLPDELEPTAWTADGLLMGVRHRSRPLWGVQFHPESISSEYGRELIANFRTLTETARGRRSARAGATSAARTRAGSTTPAAGVGDYRIEALRVDRPLRADEIYGRLFADGANSFWLDGSAARERDSQFSVLGDCSGPRAEYVTYRVAETTVRVEHADGTAQTHHTTLFDYLDSELRRRAIRPRQDLPFSFGLGYVGYLGYELKADAGGQLMHTSPVADAAMVFADRAVVVDHAAGCCYLVALARGEHDTTNAEWLARTKSALEAIEPSPSAAAPERTPASRVDRTRPRLRHDRDRYLDLIGRCLEEIRSGESYEVCLTNMASIERSVDPVKVYSALREVSQTPESALLRFSGLSVLSASPERFLRVGADRVAESKPIKGTRPRGATARQDEELRRDLLDSEKDRAENLMIVDLLRNDLSRVCIPGSVHVPKLFDVETYAPVHQLVSTVRGTLRPEVSAVQCLRAAFPAGSMVGAPKVRTMEIIDKMEDGPRGVYSGAIGYFSLTGTAEFSVVIRSMVATEKSVTFGIGGAIVALSDPDEEFEETMVKSLAMRRALGLADRDEEAATT